MKDILLEKYGFLFEDELINEISDFGTFKKYKKGEIIIHVGDDLVAFPLVLKGAIKIMSLDDQDEDLLLYYIESGDTCAMSLTCCLRESKSKIKAITENEVQLIMVPVNKLDEWSAKYKSWRSFIFENYHTRFTELLEAIDSLVFLDLENRLIKYLKDKVKINSSAILEITHKEIALDLYSSRVVISRLLKKIENKKLIKLNRNAIEVLEF